MDTYLNIYIFTLCNILIHILTRKKNIPSIFNLKPSNPFFSSVVLMFFRKYETRILSSDSPKIL